MLNNEKLWTGSKKAILAMAVVGVVTSQLQAAVILWDGGDGGWGTIGNWTTDLANDTPNPGAVPGSADTVTFNRSGNNSVATQTITLDAARTVQGITFSNAGTTTLNQGVGGTSNTLTINNGGSSNISVLNDGDVTINTSVIVGTTSAGAYVFDVGTGSLTITGQLSSPRQGSRTWTFNSTGNGYIELSGGIRLNSAVGNTNSRSNEIAGNGLVILGGAIERGSVAVNASSLGTATSFTGTLRLNAVSNDSTVVFTHNAGTLQFANNTSLPSLGLDWRGGKISAFGAQVISSPITSNSTNATLEITGSSNLTFSNDVILSGATGTAPAANRTLVVTNSGLTTFSGAFLNVNPNASTDNDVTFDVQGSSSLVISSVIRPRAAASTAGSNIIKTGTGTLELTGANTYTNGKPVATSILGGTLLANNTSGSATSTGAVTVGGASASGTPTLGGSGTISGAVTISGTTTVGTITGGNIGTAGILSLSRTAGAALTIANGAIYAWDHTAGNAAGSAGTSFDQLNINGVGGTAVISSTASTGSQLQLLFAASTDFTNSFWDANQTWNIITGGVTGSNFFDASNIRYKIGAGALSGSNAVGGQGSFTTSVDSGNLVLTWTALLGSADFKFNAPNDALTLNVLRRADNGTGANIVLTNSGTNASPTITVTSGTANVNASYTGGAFNGTANVFVSAINTGTFATGQAATVEATPSTGGNTSAITVNVGEATAVANSSFTGATLFVGESDGTTPLASRTTVNSVAIASEIDNNIDNAGYDIAMRWRTKVIGYDIAPMFSDVVNVQTTDTLYVLRMYYDPAITGSLEQSLFLGKHAGAGLWSAAGNEIAFDKQSDFSFDGGDGFTIADLGRWGIDSGSNFVWAVVNGSGDFAVIPEPTSLALLGLGAAALLGRRRQRR